MATTNHDRIGKALDLLREGLKPYVEREMAAILGETWPARAASSLHHDGGPASEKKLRRFYGTVRLDTLRMATDAGTVAEAVVQHLGSLAGAEVTVTVEIEAYLPGGAPEQVVRAVTENAATLKFTQFGFEEE